MLQHFDPNKDYGTSARVSENLITLEIDGVAVTVPEGTSVLRAAALVDINIPKLCASDNLDAFGSCRLCAVQIEGRRGYPTSCTTPVDAGMKVVTQNEKIAKLRRNIMELYISDHPLDCLTCPSNGDCELQDMAGAVGLREVRLVLMGIITLMQKKIYQILILALILANVLCAHAVCVLVKRFKVHLL